MLKKLYVSNYAIINEVEVNFEKGLNIITGETGAGKSILLGALSLILGERANSKLLSNSAKKSVVEGSFDISGHNLQPFFKANDLDFEPLTIIRRERSPSGKSRAFINDTPVTLDVLQKLTSQLVDLHKQHESLALANSHFQRNIIDGYAGLVKVVAQYSEGFSRLKRAEKQLEELLKSEAKNAQELDFWQFQAKEISVFSPEEGEESELTNQLKLLSRAEEIKTTLFHIQQLLEGEETNSLAAILQADGQLAKLSDVNDELSNLSQRLTSVQIELRDITNGIQQAERNIEVDDEKLANLTQRSDELNRLLNKHRVSTAVALHEKLAEFSSAIQAASTNTNQIIALQEQLVSDKKNLFQMAEKISAKRKNVIPTLTNKVQNLLHQMGMPSARLAIDISGEEMNSFGKDQITFLFTANKGMPLQEIGNVASGGELSRLLLAIKAVVANKVILPTMIFDEIDTGISGEVAMRVGGVMRDLAKHHQLISITHLPQIAGRGNHHLKIYKDEVDGVTHSKVKAISSDERIIAIAQMLSGADPSDTSLKTAIELLGN